MKKQVISLLAATAIAGSAVSKEVDIKISVPFPPGGGVDAVARIISNGATKLGYTVLVENKPGAGGIVGTNECVRNTINEPNLLCAVSNAQIIAIPPDLINNVQYKLDELQFVKFVARAPMVIITSPKNTKSYQEMIKDFKSNAKVNLGSPSWLNTQQTTHMLKSLGNTAHQVIDYKGANQVMVDVANQTLDYAFLPYAAVAGQFTSGILKIVAVFPPKVDIKELNQLPLVDVKDGWSENNSGEFGFVVGPKANKSDVDRLEKLITEIMKDPSTLESLKKIGLVGVDMNGNEYKKISLESRNNLSKILK